jgi:hypothetical protein
MEQGFYHPSVGYWQAVSEPPAQILAAYPEGTVSVPLMPGPGYTFNGAQWIAPSQDWIDEQAAKSIRSERQRRLVLEVDPIASNVLRWNSLSLSKQNEWAEYRSSLLNITDQIGFPHNVVWPVKPQ